MGFATLTANLRIPDHRRLVRSTRSPDEAQRIPGLHGATQQSAHRWQRLGGAQRVLPEEIPFEYDELLAPVVKRMRQDGFDDEAILADFVAAVDAISP